MRKSSLLFDSIAAPPQGTYRSVSVVNYDQGAPLHERVLITETRSKPLVAGQVRVGMLAMTINPADLLQIHGAYGVQPSPPYTPGHEGLAVVIETAEDVVGLEVGDLVLPLAPGGTWTDERILSARHVTRIEGDIDLFQCAMLSANPVTAWVLLNGLVSLTNNSCVIQNASNSAVGQCVRQLAASAGIRLINIVRRPEAVATDAIGDEHWVVDQGLLQDDFVRQVRAIAADHRVKLALDAVGGESTKKLAGTLQDGGQLVSYGLLSGVPCQIDPADLIFRGVAVQGFWLSRWFAEPANRAMAKNVIPQLLALQASGDLRMSVAATFDLENVVQALERAGLPHRTGKVLLTGAWLTKLQKHG